MSTMYSKVQFPQAPSGGFTYEETARAGLVSFASYVPSTASFIGAIVPPGWDPYSTNAADRVQYLVDTAGTLTYDDVQLDIHGLSGIQQQQINRLGNQLKNNISSGISVTVGGTSYSLDMTTSGLVSNLAKVLTAGNIVNSTADWAADTEYGANAMANVGGVILFSSAGGKSGATSPTPPTEFQTPVTDGTVEWSLMGLLINLANSRIAWMTPQNAVSAFSQAMLSLTDAEAVYLGLINEIDSFTTPSASAVAEILSVTFPASGS